MLVLWKTLLITLGGWDELRRAKDEKRLLAGLTPCEDTLRIARTMRAAPPPSIASLVGAQSSGSFLYHKSIGGGLRISLDPELIYFHLSMKKYSI